MTEAAADGEEEKRETEGKARQNRERHAVKKEKIEHCCEARRKLYHNNNIKKETKELFCVYLSNFGVNLMVYWCKFRVYLNLVRQLDRPDINSEIQKNQKGRLQNTDCVFFIFFSFLF